LNRFVVPTLWQPFLSNELTVRRNRTVSAALARPVLLERDRTLLSPQARLPRAPHPTAADPTFQSILSKMPKDAKVRVSREIAKICSAAADPPALALAALCTPPGRGQFWISGHVFTGRGREHSLTAEPGAIWAALPNSGLVLARLPAPG
jgi:hypothetical protein